jgi:pantoate--beta-alanine ligase
VLIRRMSRDLDMNVDVIMAPITREAGGLALSSRNVYLDPEERRAATALSRALDAAGAVFAGGERSAAALLAASMEVLDREPAVRVQYLELVEPDDLRSVDVAIAGHVVAIAAFVGRTRLIDNLILA